MKSGLIISTPCLSSSFPFLLFLSFSLLQPLFLVCLSFLPSSFFSFPSTSLPTFPFLLLLLIFLSFSSTSFNFPFLLLFSFYFFSFFSLPSSLSPITFHLLPRSSLSNYGGFFTSIIKSFSCYLATCKTVLINEVWNPTCAIATSQGKYLQ